LPSRERTTLATFRGTIHPEFLYSKGVRQSLLELSKEHPQLQVSIGMSPYYWNELGQSQFSLCPSGWSCWSPRLFDRFRFIYYFYFFSFPFSFLFFFSFVDLQNRI